MVSDDIVERLRWMVEEGGYNDNITDLAQSCADEIERLRKLVAWVTEYLYENQSTFPNADGDEFNRDDIIEMDYRWQARLKGGA